MKKLLFITIVLTSPLLTRAQERLSKAYIGAILHDFKSPGASILYSFGINKYLGVGPGFDVSNYETDGAGSQKLKSTVASIYADVRGRYSVGKIEPFAFVQGGYPSYKQEGQFITNTPTAQPITRKGKYFYGGGVGVNFKIGQVGVFASYAQRIYQFKYDPSNVNVNGRPLKDMVDNSASAGIITAGITF